MIDTAVTGRHEHNTGQLPARRSWQPIAAVVVLLCTGLLVLSGCVHGTDSMTHHHYTLAAATPTPARHASTQRGSGPVLSIARIDVPPWLAGTAMYYRLAYRDGHRLAAYAYSDWAAPPATLVADIIRSALAAGGGWQAVVGPSNPAQADIGLQLRIANFSQVFKQPDKSVGVIEATATLLDNPNAHIIAQQHFRVHVAANSPDAQGGARALAQASRQLATALQHWIQDTVSTRP